MEDANWLRRICQDCVIWSLAFSCLLMLSSVGVLASLYLYVNVRSPAYVYDKPKILEPYWGPGLPASSLKANSTRYFKKITMEVTKETIDDLHQRIDRTLMRKPIAPLEGTIGEYGLPPDQLEAVLNYWRYEYNWTVRQAKYNQYPHYRTEVQGLSIHFYRIRSTFPSTRESPKRSLLLIHGWPSSNLEFQRMIPELSQPRSRYSLDLIIPSLPGCGYSDAPAKPDFGPADAAVVMKNLMLKLGYKKFYVHGVGWGSVVATNLAILFPEYVRGLHTTMCFVMHHRFRLLSYAPEKYDHILSGEYFDYYNNIQSVQPDTISTGLSHSPSGLLAFLFEKYAFWHRRPENRFRDEGNATLSDYDLDTLVDNGMLFWLTNSVISSIRMHAEYLTNQVEPIMNLHKVNVPSACSRFSDDITPEINMRVLRGRYTKLFEELPTMKGGHFAAYEQPTTVVQHLSKFLKWCEVKPKYVAPSLVRT